MTLADVVSKILSCCVIGIKVDDCIWNIQIKSKQQ